MVNWEPSGRTRSEPEPEPQPTPGPEVAPAGLLRIPARRLAIVTCMDSRLDPLRDLGLARGDAMIMRNAGATLSEDVERSLRVAHEQLEVNEVWLVGHTDCVAHAGDDDAVRAALRDGVRRVRGTLPAVSVRMLLFDLRTGVAAPVA